MKDAQIKLPATARRMIECMLMVGHFVCAETLAADAGASIGALAMAPTTLMTISSLARMSVISVPPRGRFGLWLTEGLEPCPCISVAWIIASN